MIKENIKNDELVLVAKRQMNNLKNLREKLDTLHSTNSQETTFFLNKEYKNKSFEHTIVRSRITDKPFFNYLVEYITKSEKKNGLMELKKSEIIRSFVESDKSPAMISDKEISFCYGLFPFFEVLGLIAPVYREFDIFLISDDYDTLDFYHARKLFYKRLHLLDENLFNTPITYENLSMNRPNIIKGEENNVEDLKDEEEYEKNILTETVEDIKVLLDGLTKNKHKQFSLNEKDFQSFINEFKSMQDVEILVNRSIIQEQLKDFLIQVNESK